MAVRVDLNKCTGCGACVGACSWGALSLLDNEIVVDDQRCGNCGTCVQACANDALELVIEAVPVETVPSAQSHNVVELDVRPVACASPAPAANRSSVGWLSLLGRAAGTVAAYLIDRTLDGGSVPRGSTQCPRNRRAKGMRHRRGR